ncbi:Nuclear pore complex protein NUP88 [Ananas comosus]|uniref:Nuclear pore complex protein NUP88 n=1 Tax=Ananas comosus TaxID=4615 RepID=A0A199UPN1_ANACO|nr:Nuclear pore complex protein NUP88 [Ananas comosus]
MAIMKAPSPPSSPPPPHGSDGGGSIRRSPAPAPAPPAPLSLPSDPQKKPSLEWVPLQKHPVFASRSPISSDSGELRRGSAASGGGSSAAWDAALSRLYVWDSVSRCVHRLALRLRDLDADSASSTDFSVVVEAAIPSEKLIPDTQIPSIVSHISLNADGSSLILAGSDFLRVIYIYERISVNGNTVTCRMVSVASQILTGENSGLQALQISWHPFSNSHLGVLTSDSVFRLFDLSSDLERPEQEYYLQPIKPGSCHNAVSICPVAFSYGGHHLWDRFSVFILFSDGSIYVLCPVVPFGRRYIQEIYEDVIAFGLTSSNPKIVSNSRLAISWLEATFPDVADQSTEVGSVSLARAHAYAPGPLCKVSHGEENNNIEGKAVGFLYNSVGKDSIIVTAWSSGQLQIDAFADEIQPHWNTSFPPRLDIDRHGDLRGFAMICESNFQDNSASKLQNQLEMGSNSSNNVDSVWLGPSPPLLRLALVDLALPNANPSCMLSLFPDPLVGERFYCVHGGGIDMVSLHFLPFSDAGTNPKPPSVHPILATGNEESCSPFLSGFVTIADAYGHLQIVGITLSYECIVVEMKGWKEPMPINYEFDSKSANDEEAATIPEFISKELLAGPKTIILPASASLRSLTADSIEGRSTLHHYIKLFHENYVEYAHKVYIELKEHADYLKTVIDDQQKRLHAVKQSLARYETKEQGINDRIDRAFKVYELLEMRLESFKTLPARNKKPLSRAEREFKAQLDRFGNIELDALHSAIEALNARMKRYSQPSLVGRSPQQTSLRGRNYISDNQMSLLKSSLEKLSIINEQNTQKLKLIENELKSQE